jgi:sulfite exporter TauE/SafE
LRYCNGGSSYEAAAGGFVTPFLLAFLVGLLSALHCVGMCGGIVGALTFSLPVATRRDWRRLVLFLLAYNAGRVVSYALAGAAFGWLGEALIATGPAAWPHRLLQWVAALAMVGIGLYVAGWFPRFAQVERMGAPLWQRLEPLGRRLLPVATLPRALVYGAVWGWLPCGLVYTMLIAAPAQGGPAAGALYMALFGLGTLPAMLAVGLLTGRLYAWYRDHRVQVAAGLSVVTLGLFTLLFQGYNVNLF